VTAAATKREEESTGRVACGAVNQAAVRTGTAATRARVRAVGMDLRMGGTAGWVAKIEG
jgi:hypothetical protein